MNLTDRQSSGWTVAFVADVGVTLGALAFATLIVVLEVGGPLQIVTGIAIALLFPGYACTTAMFPANKPSSSPRAEAAGIGLLERIGLAMGLSVVGITAIALGFGLAQIPLEVRPLLLSLVGATVMLFVVGVVRRGRLPAQRRYVFPVIALVRPQLGGRTSVDTLLNVSLVVVMLLSVGTLGYALAAPQDGTTYTDVRLLTELESGQLAETGYKVNYTRGERGSYVLAIENQEQGSVTYNIVIELQRVHDSDGNVTVVASQQLQTLEATVDATETRNIEHTIEPSTVGENQRLVYLVYRGDPAANPSTDTAYRYNYIWISVREK